MPTKFAKTPTGTISTGGGGGLILPSVREFSETNYYSSAIANPFAGQTLVTLIALAEVVTNTFTEQVVFSSLDYDGVGGINSGLSFVLGNNGITPGVRFWDNGGTVRNAQASWPSSFPYLGKLVLVAFELDTSGGSADYTVRVNGSPVANSGVGGAGGALSAGSGSHNLLVGRNLTGETRVGAGLRLHGFGYQFGTFLTFEEHAAWFMEVQEGGVLVDTPTGADLLYAVDGADPGATWSPIVGSGDLTEVGAVPYDSSLATFM